MSIDQITISKFSAMTKLSTKALRLYDKRGLLEPAIRDPINNYRYYGIEQLEDAIRIKLLSSIGFGIDDMRSILDAVSKGDDEYLNRKFDQKHSEIQLEINRLQKIEEIIRTNKPTELMYMQCSEPELKELPKVRVLSKRTLGTYAGTVPQLIGELMSVIYAPENSRNMVTITGPLMLLIHDNDYKEDDADIEMAIPISGRINIDSDDIEVKNLPQGKAISLIYTGPYADVGIAYTKAMEFAHTHGYKVLPGGAREIYLNDPNQVADDQLMTELQIQIKENEEDDK